MNRVRALLIKSSRKMGRPVLGAANWWRSIRTTPAVPLASMRRRLELLLAAMYGAHFEIEALPVEAGTNLPGARRPPATACFHDATIELPVLMNAKAGVSVAIARYRLLAIEQAARIVRGSCALAPSDDETVARDLFNLREGAQIDATIARQSPPLAALLTEERERALASRKQFGRMSDRERAVEALLSTVLRSEPLDLPREMQGGESPEASLVWARQAAASIAQLGGSYRSRPPVSIWGATLSRNGSGSRDVRASQGSMIPPSPGYGSGQSTLPYGGDSDDRQEPASAGTGEPTAANERDSEDEDGTDPLPDETRAGRAETTVEGAGRMHVPGSGTLNELDASILAAWRSDGGILYPEWDCNASTYRELGAVVRQLAPAEGSTTWADHVLDEHPALVRRVRREFERLRARRTRLLRQRDGDELDLDACVRAIADASTGDATDERLYVAVRAARRTIAITLLVDVSGSTRDEVSDGRRVIDVEKMTLLLASEAFDALGDAYSIQTFASGGAADVRVATLKEFRESNGDTVRRRIAGIEAGGNTRLGAAIRHATAMISAQPAGHRLLLILSDGKPNDVDRYFLTYAIEDSRQAVFEARAAGIYPYCLTIDAHDPDPYLARVFGTAGHAILRRPEQLPVSLLDLVRELLRGGGAR